MASVSSSTSSLNNSIRGYGGMASGMDRDALIEQMLQGMDSKIDNVNKKITKTEWKQEAYQSLSDKIIALQDDYFGYSASSSLTSSSTFAKNQVSTIGKSDVTQYVSATGTSSMTEYLSILGVQKLATSAVRVSDSKKSGVIMTNISSLTDTTKYSNLQGTNLVIGTYNSDDSFNQIGKFTFPSTYTDENGKTQTIDYTTTDTSKLVEQLNIALKDANFGKADNFDGYLQFNLETDGSLSLVGKDKNGNDVPDSFVINSGCSALGALGLDKDAVGDTSKGISIGTFNANSTDFASAAISSPTWTKYLENQKLSFTYGGQTKEIDLTVSDNVASLDEYKELLQKRIDKAFGAGKIEVSTTEGALSFNTVSADDSLTIHSDDMTLRNNLGITKNASNKISVEGTIADSWEKLGFKLNLTDEDKKDSVKVKTELDNLLKDFTINGVKIEGLTSDMTINEMLEKINDTTDAGVKASYLSGTNQFVLVATETGSGRSIELGGNAETIFGSSNKDNNRDGEDAVIEVSYGNGLTTTIKSASNTFDLEGLKVTVTGTFGYKTDDNGNFKKDENDNLIRDTSQSVSFSAKADVDGVTETVKKFIEAYNELVKEINTQMTTKPSSYQPLTDDEKDALDDTTIEKWEKKAKEGLLYGDSTLRSLSSDLQGIFTQFMSQNGVSIEMLEDMGISYSDDYLDGGTIVFDESKFKEAMESDPESVSNVFAGGGKVKTSFTKIIESTLTKYATRYATKNGNSYGLLIEEAGSSKIPTSARNNQKYRELQDLQEQLEKLKDQRQTKEDHYISIFTAMETAISNMNTQSSYLSSLQA